ncbi:MAG: glycosyltransferase family 9 protein [Deltaproteobacteria bacterium]|nr:glycosyltransferase family 9 protein [Deltaproteobacteria bacterium]
MTGLVIQPMKLGDLVQSTPLLTQLKKEVERLILVVARPEVAVAAKITNLPDEVIFLPEAEFIKGEFSPASQAELNKLPHNPDLLVNLSSSAPSLALAERFKARTHLGPQKGPNGLLLPPAQKIAAAVMAVDRSLGRLNLVDIWRHLAPAAKSAGKLVWPLSPPDSVFIESFNSLFLARADRTPLVGLHLGSGNHLRRWPVERFAHLAKALAPARCVLLGSQGERSLARRFLALFDSSDSVDSSDSKIKPEKPIDLTGQTTLASLGQVISLLDLFVSADTGVMHIAAAVGVPILAVFGGPALAGETGPYANGSIIVQGHSHCSPCAENKPCPARPCPALPQAGPVLAEARKILSNMAKAKVLTGQPTGQSLGPDLSPFLDPSHSHDHSPCAIPKPQNQAEAYSLTFEVSSDDLGQTLKPAEPTYLTDRERLALSIRESAAAHLKPCHERNPYLEKMDNYLYSKDNKPASDLLPVIKSVANLAIDRKDQRQNFIDRAMAALELMDGIY